jgi:acyl carrier protein
LPESTLDGREVRDRLREFVRRELLGNPNYPLRDDEPLITGGLIDSFALAQVGVFIEQAFGVYLPDTDLTAAAEETLSWMDGARAEPPARLDLLWRGSLPPRLGWRRLDVVPDTAIRDVVRVGAREIKSLGGTAPRREQALLDAVVLTAESEDGEAKITLRVAAALTRMGFLPRDSRAGVDVVGRWIRLAGGYGAVYAEQSGAGLSVV